MAATLVEKTVVHWAVNWAVRMDASTVGQRVPSLAGRRAATTVLRKAALTAGKKALQMAELLAG